MNKSNEKSHEKRNLILLCLVLLIGLATCGIASIHAYFTDSDFVTNQFSVGNSTIQFVENDATVKVQNTGSVPCFIRVFAEPERPETTLPTKNTTKWTAGGDGYYYYNDDVAANGITESLFSSELPANAEVVVYAECIQAEGILGDNETVLDAFNPNK